MIGSDINAGEVSNIRTFSSQRWLPTLQNHPPFRLPPSRLQKAFDPVNIITGEMVGAGRQRDFTVRGKCRDTDESGRYGEHFGAKIMPILSEQLPTLTRR